MNSIPRPEYPRPRLVREKWLNLNGEWQFEIDNALSGKERDFHKRESFNEKIIVPFVPESKLSGIENVDFIKGVWYKKEFEAPSEWDLAKGKVILHFGAVDYLSDVWINGEHAGQHKGGYTPFSFDITKSLKNKENSITVFAYDDVKCPLQPTGKQSERYHNYGCLYTRSTGIWQTVWLEYVPLVYIKKLKLTPDVDNSCLDISVIMNAVGSKNLKATAYLSGQEAGSCEVKISGKYASAKLEITKLALWFPESPVLYDIVIETDDDKIESYFGMRKVVVKGYAIEINDKPIYQRLVLDQGYYPDGIYTAPSDEDLKNDILLSQEVGFNGARMHMKVFEPRFSYWADKLGYLLWAEYPNWGLDISNPAALLAMLPEWMEAVERDYNSPAIIGWCPFNETGTNRIAEIYSVVMNATRAYDPIRPIIDTSGYVHGAETDIYDVHDYTQDPKILKAHHEKMIEDESLTWKNFPHHDGEYKGQPYFVSEFGGAWWNIDGGENGWGYGEAPKSLEEFYTRYEGLVDVLLSHPKMCAFCYTQLTDVFQEKNGIFSFNRVRKFDSERLKAINSKKAYIEK